MVLDMKELAKEKGQRGEEREFHVESDDAMNIISYRSLYDAVSKIST